MSWFAKAFFTVRMQEYCSRQQGRHRPSVPKGQTCLEEINSLLATMLRMCPCPKLNSRFCSRILSFRADVPSLRRPTESSCGGFRSFQIPLILCLLSFQAIPTPAARRMSSVSPVRMGGPSSGIQDSQRLTCVICSSPPHLSEGMGERDV